MSDEKDFYVSSRNGMTFLACYNYGRYDVVDEDSDTVLIVNLDVKDGNISDEEKQRIGDIAEKEYNDLNYYSVDDDWTTGDEILNGEGIAISHKKHVAICLIPLFDDQVDNDFSDAYEFNVDIPSSKNILVTKLIDSISSEELYMLYQEICDERDEAIKESKSENWD